jgi:hypothetical protein
MELENQAAESGPDTGNAGGDVSTTVTEPQTSGLSLKDSLAKAASKFQERSSETDTAKSGPDARINTAFEPKGQTKADSPNGQAGSQEEAVAPSILEAPKHWPQKRREAFAKFASQPDFVKEWLDHPKGSGTR